MIVHASHASAGDDRNKDLITEIVKETSLSVQFGGGLRDEDQIKYWMDDAGVDQVILGTLALKNPDLVRKMCLKYPEGIVAALDAKDGFVTVEGWTQTSNVKVLDLALKLEGMGVSSFIYTDIDLDGTQLGPNLDTIVDLAWALSTPVISNGGVSSIEDITLIKREEDSGLAGVIVGSSLYNGRIDAAAALKILQEE